MHRIEVCLKSHLPDARGEGLVKDIHDLGITTVTDVRVVDIYWLDADLASGELDLIGHYLLADLVTHEYQCFALSTDIKVSLKRRSPFKSSLPNAVEVAYNAGVTDPIEDSVLKAIRDLGLKNVRAAKTSRRYLIAGRLDQRELDVICSRLLVNPIIQHVVERAQFDFSENPQYRFKREEVDITASDKKGLARRFGFSADEFQAIVDYFRQQGRNPVDVELETLAQTWSEHCVHKTFKGKIRYHGKTIDNLLKSTVMKATRELNKPWCLSVFMDNAGVIDFDGRWALCFKVETHNHPSALEPYGGAATGIGGVIRDPLGTGLGAKPILNTDVFCFGPPDLPYEKLPQGVLHPRRMFKGVRAGVADYANRLGIPTLSGAVLFDQRYVANPLVYCGTLGLVPKNMAQRGKQQTGDLVVLVGGRTGRDGIHGVTFASEQLTGESTDISSSSVQIGNPIVEKKVIDVLLQARDRGLYVRITDCGGGGLSSAVGEMAADAGVRVDLEKVPLKYAGLSYSEIWISESQERMVLAVPPEYVEELLRLFAGEDVEATVIGEFTDDRRLQLFYHGNLVGDLDMKFLHEGMPQLEKKVAWKQSVYVEPDFPEPPDLSEVLIRILASWNVCSKEWVIRQYDYEVQGGNVLKPLVGKNNDGPGDAAVIRPVMDTEKGVIVANGINPKYGDIDPYWMAASAIDEALRQVIAVGGNLGRVALLDNFCWGNTARPEMLGALVRAAQACYDMSVVYGTPFISGKDSLNNEFEFEGKTVAIPHTLLVSAVGVMNDVNRAVSMDFKQAGDFIYILGSTWDELGGSEYFQTHGLIGNNVPRVDPRRAKALMDKLSAAMEDGLVRACHDCSEGGIGVAVAEMAFAGWLGAAIRLKAIPLGESVDRDDFILFSESNSRFLVEVASENRAEFEKVMARIDLAVIGEVTDGEVLEIYGVKDEKKVAASIGELKEAWQRPLRW
ncbi:MAG: phosphoribosylformylglycinamidine synthase subunit PurL [Dehalococcoidales bacterium]|jgi:phosphoribosylformylglycinamidine synthase|nr:phosphoribosylformylglycinamidine synthase subunit PurL [Dehalococcoidales bacterium]MDP6825372.1 phosphoribosylformylglycinamidine synthase subunit PurL [Dehalococcoidales bacterium]